MQSARGGCLQPLSYLTDDPPDHRRCQRRALHQGGQSVALHVLVDDKPDFTVIADVEHPNESVVIDQRHPAGGVRDIGRERMTWTHHPNGDSAIESGVDGTPQRSVRVALKPFFEPVSAR
jgi:hypothetical protein